MKLTMIMTVLIFTLTNMIQTSSVQREPQWHPEDAAAQMLCDMDAFIDQLSEHGCKTEEEIQELIVQGEQYKLFEGSMNHMFGKPNMFFTLTWQQGPLTITKKQGVRFYSADRTLGWLLDLEVTSAQGAKFKRESLSKFHISADATPEQFAGTPIATFVAFLKSTPIEHCALAFGTRVKKDESDRVISSWSAIRGCRFYKNEDGSFHSKHDENIIV